MNFYAQKSKKSTENLPISLNEVVYFTNGSAHHIAYVNDNEMAYKGFVDKAIKERKPRDLTMGNSLIILPLKPYVPDFLKKVMLHDAVLPYSYYPRPNCKTEI